MDEKIINFLTALVAAAVVIVYQLRHVLRMVWYPVQCDGQVERPEILHAEHKLVFRRF